MSTVEICEEAAKLPPDDLERLVEDLIDLKLAREALARIDAGDEPIPWEKLKLELDELHG
jgi:predicted DNA-binding protein